MKSISVALDAHFGGELTTLAVCLRIACNDGTFICATNHDQDIVITDFDAGSPSVSRTYLSIIGGTDSDVQTSNALTVDTFDQRGPLSTQSINESDMYASRFDHSPFIFFAVNYNDLTQGIYRLRDGWLGKITLDRDAFVEEMQGMMDALKRAIGKLVNPLCPYNLGDYPFAAPYRGRCTKDLTDFTVSGTLESISDDQATLFDSARTELGPAGSVSITNVTNSNPCVITTATDLGLIDGDRISLAGIGGMPLINGVEVLHNPGTNTFEIALDTSDSGTYGTYTSGGTATPLVADSGYFGAGLCTINSGPNIDKSREIKSSDVGQWTLQLPFDPALTGTEDYTLIAGCNKTTTHCDVKFDNLINFGGFPFVPGQDKIIQVAPPQASQGGGKK